MAITRKDTLVDRINRAGLWYDQEGFTYVDLSEVFNLYNLTNFGIGSHVVKVTDNLEDFINSSILSMTIKNLE